MGESNAGPQIDLLKPHVRAFLDEAKRIGSTAALAAFYEVEAKLPDELKAAANAPASCEALHVLAAVASELGWDAWESGDLDGAFGYFGDAYTYRSAAHAQGCD